ncbi:hypothetical protein NLJ89_g6505 [Agrocybe chaxingu]|uniref:YhhN domain-containing protein n=1 Tax=Agrocybe chaxingu TaxID=84603 RepID=A0A9W8K0N5_9AGAR|nr:hypothetical protein NLJ89_g6505 [Agrocybe chaxingu]
MKSFRPPSARDFTLPPPPFPTALATCLGLLIASEASAFYAGSAGFKVLASLCFLIAGVSTASARLDLLSWAALTDPENRFTVGIVLGLVFSVVGDVLLIPSRANYIQLPQISESEPKKGKGKKKKSSRPQSQTQSTPDSESPSFKAGMLAFGLAHISYTLAFLSTTTLFPTATSSFPSPPTEIRWGDFGMTLTFGALLTDWLGLLKPELVYGAWFDVPKKMKPLVAVYVAVIMAMVATATATDTGYQKIAGAWIFMISDLFVAANAFGVKEEEEPQDKTTERRGRGRPEWRSTSIGWVAYYAAQMLLAGCI